MNIDKTRWSILQNELYAQILIFEAGRFGNPHERESPRTGKSTQTNPPERQYNNKLILMCKKNLRVSAKICNFALKSLDTRKYFLHEDS